MSTTPQNAAALLTQPPPGQAPDPNANSGGGGGGGGGEPWYAAGVKNPDVKTWLDGKKYADLETLASSAFSSERLIGADKAGRTVLLPKDDNDAEGIKALRAKLGVPETAEGYKLPLPQGDDGVFAKTAATWFHKHGIPAKAAEGIAAEWNTFIESQVKAGDEADKGEQAQAIAALQQEWGTEFAAKSETSRRGLRAIGKEAGLDDKDLVALESTLGTSKMLKMFQQIGGLTKEGGFAGGDGGGHFGMTPEQAQAQMNALIADRSAGKITDYDWNTGDTSKKINQLMAVITGEQKAA